jgi:dihydrofolate reductase
MHMGKLIYTAITSLDGYVEDGEGSIAWSAPNDELVSFINDLERPIGTYLYGRRMYETMLYWEADDRPPEPLAALDEFRTIWRAADKIVYSRMLNSASSAKTKIERDFDARVIRQLKADSGHDMSIGGASLAAQAIMSQLVDEYRAFVFPVILGGGKSWLPNDVGLDLELIDTRRFSNGFVHLRYRPRR